ncbi:MAG: ribosome silencing factor [Deltaproteobacteria bacterium]|nr:ribosome silencing factor [Deltaproteobacteria bacterium]
MSSKAAAAKTELEKAPAAAGASAPGKPKAPPAPASKARPRAKTVPESRELASLICKAAGEHKVDSPVLLNIAGSHLTDFFYIASAESSRQVKAVAEKIILRLKENGIRPLGVEGLAAQEARWVLLDFGDVIAHVFLHEARELYDLEGLWADAPREDPGALSKPGKVSRKPSGVPGQESARAISLEPKEGARPS